MSALLSESTDALPGVGSDGHRMLAPPVAERASITLQEFDAPETSALTAAECDILRSRFTRYITLSPTFTAGTYKLAATHFVGVIQIDDLRTRIERKTPAPNLFHMLTYAWDLDIDWNESTELQQGDDIFEFNVKHFVQQVEELVRQGIYRAYRSQDDDLIFLPGRLRLQDQLRREVTASGRFAQHLHEYTADVDENRILLWTLARLARLHWRDPLLSPRIRRLERVFAEVSLTPVSDATFDAIVYTRLNEGYHSRHRLARLLLHMHTLEGSEGAHRFNG